MFWSNALYAIILFFISLPQLISIKVSSAGTICPLHFLQNLACGSPLFCVSFAFAALRLSWHTLSQVGRVIFVSRPDVIGQISI
jgi:hypothetical protein